MTRFLALAAFVFLFPLCQWLGDEPAHRVTLTEPRVVGEVMLYRKEWYRIEELRRWRADDITVYTFYSDGHCTVSKGE